VRFRTVRAATHTGRRAANGVYGSRMQVDAAATVGINRRWRAFVEGINLTNSPVRYAL
jgi:hypothetical protein